MDNDEILNVRWATEDPNPTTKDIEKRRLEEIGTAAIASKLDPRMVDAMRSVRALEEGEAPEEQQEALPTEVEEPPKKRRKVNSRSEDEEDAVAEPPKIGLLSNETLQGIRALSEIRNKRLGAQPPKSKPGLSALMDYGSDDDDDD
jgi:hypothetical protein